MLKKNNSLDKSSILENENYTVLDYFDFIGDVNFRELLVRDFIELENCIENKAIKSVLILSGSIIEAVLLEYFTHKPIGGKSITEIMKMDLFNLISEAKNVGLISSRSFDLSTVIKNYRNLIHPGRELRIEETLNIETAIVSYNLVKMVLQEIKGNYIKTYGYRAEDIFNKIIKDHSSTHAIYDKLLDKLNSHERGRLLDLLAEYHINNSWKRSYVTIKNYFFATKLVVEESKLIEQLEKLFKRVEIGKETEIIILFELYGDNLNLLTIEKRELILIYLYNVLGQITNESNLNEYRNRNLYNCLSNYLETEKLKKKYFGLILKIVKYRTYSENKWELMDIYYKLIENLDSERKEKVNEFIRENMTENQSKEFFKSFETHNDFPF